MGKPHSDLMDMQLVWFGSYDECVATETIVPVGVYEADHRIHGRYCKAAYVLGGGGLNPFAPAVTIGLCVPNSCNPGDVTGLLNTLTSFVPINTTSWPAPVVSCQLDSLEYTTKAIVVICVCAAFVATIITGTVYDVAITFFVNKAQESDSSGNHTYPLSTKGTGINETSVICKSGTPLDGSATINEKSVQNGHESAVHTSDVKLDVTQPSVNKTSPYKPGILGKLLLSFSVYTNLGKVLNTSQHSGTLTAVHGIRFISMAWVILGHTLQNGLGIFQRHLFVLMPQLFRTLSFQVIGNGTFSVDTFFCLSGLLVTYLSLKEMKKVGGAKKFKWVMYYFHRFWRLTPPYMLTLMVYITVVKYWYNGPLWEQQPDECEDTWWWNLLYINNLMDPFKQCMGWSWYLANDMQFHLVSPMLLIPLHYSRLWGGICCLAVIVASSIARAVLSVVDDFSANAAFAVTNPAQSEDMYVKPWCRIGPYVVGMLAGYLLCKTKCKIRMRKTVNVAGWIIAGVVALLVVYGLWNNTDTGAPTLNKGTTALYNATSRTVWSMCVCWVIVACATGYGGPVNTFLSWKSFIPLSRLSYCAYLVHPIVMGIYVMQKRSLVYYTHLEIAYQFMGHTCIGYAAALVVSLAFEAPMMGLEKALLGRARAK